MIKDRNYLKVDFIEEKKLLYFITMYSRPDFSTNDIHSMNVFSTIPFKLYCITNGVNLDHYISDPNPVVRRSMGLSGYLPHKFINCEIPQVSIQLAQNEYGLNLFGPMYNSAPYKSLKPLYHSRMKKVELLLNRDIFDLEE